MVKYIMGEHKDKLASAMSSQNRGTSTLGTSLRENCEVTVIFFTVFAILHASIDII